MGGGHLFLWIPVFTGMTKGAAPAFAGVQWSTIEYMIAQPREARTVPTGRNARGVEKQRAGNRAGPAVIHCDAGNGNGGAPLAIFRRSGDNPAMHKGKLAALAQYAANAGRKAARFGAVHHDIGNRQLSFERFGARFIIDGGGEAAMFRAIDAGIGHFDGFA